MINKDIIFKYRIKLSKSSDSASAHERRRMLQGALNASGLKYATNKGQPKFSLGPGAQQGEASACEYADICLLEETNIETIKTKLAPNIAGGFKIEEIREIPFTICSVEALAQYARYNIKGIKADTDKFNAAQKAEIEIHHDNGMREFKNIKPFVHSINKLNGDEVEIIIELSAVRSFGLRQMLTELPGLEVPQQGVSILRSELLWQSPQGGLKAVW